jgi:hypothetical protein
VVKAATASAFVSFAVPVIVVHDPHRPQAAICQPDTRRANHRNVYSILWLRFADSFAA